MKKLMCAAGILLLWGCGPSVNYYQITDLQSQMTYITDSNHVQDNRRRNGSLVFEDLETEKQISLTDAEIKSISSEQAELELGKE